MEFLKKIEWSTSNILKALGLFIISVFVLATVFRTLSPMTGMMLQNPVRMSGVEPSAGSMYQRAVYDGGDAYAEEAMYAAESGGVRLSANNVSMPSPGPQYEGSMGRDAEDFEVTQYSASIETRDSERTCNEISNLKGLDYVIFENANEYDKGCNYVFKVEHENASEVLAIIETFNPKNLSENTRTIKREIDDFTSETEILEKKLSSINETLESAVTAYDEIAALASRTQDAESLAKIIDSKINTIERLTQQRINITAQLERLSRGKAEQLDRLEYTYFDINVYENKFVDGENLKDSWRAAIKGFVRDMNQIAQDMTINLVMLLFLLLQYTLYLFIVVVAAKYIWRAASYVWKK